MLTMTPEYAAERERKARETLDWLEGNFHVKPLRAPVIARLDLSRGAAKANAHAPGNAEAGAGI